MVCRVIQQDARRADPILEGAPVGEVIRWRESPSFLANLCCGQGPPVAGPDSELRDREFGQGHHSACPIYSAGREIEFATAEHKRAFEAPVQPDLEDTSAFDKYVTLDKPSFEMGS